jgi:hypothetical protein
LILIDLFRSFEGSLFFIFYEGAFMKKIIRIILIFIIICVSSYAQQWDWTIISNTLNNQPTFSYGSGGHSLVTDNSGNIYLGGNLSDSISLGDTIIYSKVGETELLAIKYSPLGSPLWIKHTGGNDNGNHVSGIGLDDFGNTYITGITNDTCYFDTILTNSNGLNPSFFIAKINTEGEFEWAKVAGRNLLWAYSIGNSITISEQNEIYVAGVFSYELFLQGTHLNTYGGRDIFVAKYDQNGYLQWVKQAGSIYDDTPSSIAVDSNGNCYVTGQIENNARFGQFTVLTNGTSIDGFITKLDNDGNFLWAKSFGSNHFDIGTSISYFSEGYLFLTGQINGTAFFDNITVQHNGGNDIFIARYDLNGNISLAKGFGGNNNENANNIFINNLGNILVTGEFEGIGVFDTTHLNSLGHTDLFAAEFNFECNLDWVIQYGTDLIDFGYAISADRFDNVFVAGAVGGYQGSLGILDRSIFLGKIKNPITPVELTIFMAIVSNSSVQLSWSTATELNNHGFEIERSLDKTIWATIGFREGYGTTSEPQDYTYSDDISEISSSKLYYRLKQIDFNGSFEYSKIVEVEIAPTKFTLRQNYPNPFNPSTSIQYTIASRQFVTLKVYDVLGKEITALVNEEKSAGSYNIEFNASHLATGIYYYQLRAGDYVKTKKMILLK